MSQVRILSLRYGFKLPRTEFNSSMKNILITLLIVTIFNINAFALSKTNISVIKQNVTDRAHSFYKEPSHNLTSIHIDIDININYILYYENLSFLNGMILYESYIDTSFNLYGLNTANTFFYGTKTLSPFDYMIDFNGSSGFTENIQNNYQYNFDISQDDFNIFAGSNGSFQIPIYMNQNWVFEGTTDSVMGYGSIGKS